MIDFNSAQFSQRVFQSDAAASAKQVSSSDTDASSEAGEIGQDIGAAIAQWNEQLNSDLTDWYNDAQAMQGILEQAQFVASEIAYCYSNAQTAYTAGGALITGYYVPASHYDNLMQAMSDLGIPQSQIVTGTYYTSGDHAGKVYLSVTGFQEDLNLMVQYAKADMPQLQSELSSYQQDETKDMLAVMYDTTAIKQNEQSLSGIWSALKQMAQLIEGNIQ